MYNVRSKYVLHVLLPWANYLFQQRDNGTFLTIAYMDNIKYNNKQEACPCHYYTSYNNNKAMWRNSSKFFFGII